MLNARSLSGNNVCRTKKKANAIKIRKEVAPALRRTTICKQGIFAYKHFGGKAKSVEDALKLIEDEMSHLPRVNELSHQLQVNEAIYLANKYLMADDRRCYKPTSKVVSIFDEEFEVTPDFVFEYNHELDCYSELPVVEVVVLSAGRTDIGSSKRHYTADNSVYKNLFSMCLLLYGLDILGDRKGFVRVTFDFLKTNKDKNGDFSTPWSKAAPNKSSSSDNRVWYEALFENKQIITSINAYDPIEPSNLFVNFKKSFEDYKIGTEKCSKTLCDKCEYNEICNYVHPPLKKEQAVIKKDLSSFTLSKEQEQIISFEEGIARVNAGAGVGKTFVIVQRIINLLTKGYSPNGILMTTFTNAGIDEMKERVDGYIDAFGLPVNPNDITISSFNSLGNTLIQNNYLKLGFTAEPTLIDEVEQIDLLLELIKDKPPIEGLDYKNILMNGSGALCGAVVFLKKQFDIIRGGNLSLSEYIKHNDAETAEEIYELCREYNAMMKAHNYIDYSDQSNLVEELLQLDPLAIIKEFKYEHIIVDEFQDSNDFQLMFISELISSTNFKSLMVVGDDSQAIYGFRGTSPDNIIHFEEKIGASITDFYLNTSFRSTKSIVNCANDIISLNKNRIDKTMRSSKAEGEKPLFKGFVKQTDELKYIAERIKELIEGGEKPEDIAFISFKNSTLNALNKNLSSLGLLALPNTQSFLNNSRVISAIELAEFFYSPDSTKGLMVYLNDIFNDSFLSMDPKEVNRIIKHNLDDFINIYIPLDINSKKDYLLKALCALDDGTDPVYKDFLDKVLSKKNYTAIELIDYIIKFKSYSSSDTSKIVDNYEAITLTTAHSSKGLEWKHVFVSISDFDRKTAGNQSYSSSEVEEKRRLIFVAATRAKEHLTVTSVRDFEVSSGNVYPNRYYSDIKSLSSFRIEA